MSYTARLHIEGHQLQNEGIRVTECEFGFAQEIDIRGMPVSEIRGGIINLSIIIENDSEILWWMISATADKNGYISFLGDDPSKPYKKVEFKDARLVSYNEYFKEQAEVIIKLKISSRNIIVAGESHENVWTGYPSG